MKTIFTFLLFFFLSVSVILVYTFLKQSPGKPINKIIETAVNPTIFSVENPPSQSIRGNILSMSGDIYWESRIATEESIITSPVTLSQGEEIRTGDLAKTKIEFPNEVDIEMSPKTQIGFAQTLPVNFTASIASGSAIFTRIGNTPISIRVMHLLLEIQSGKLALDIDSDNSLVNINVIDGSIKAAFNDNSLISQILTFNKGQKVTFSDRLRTFE